MNPFVDKFTASIRFFLICCLLALISFRNDRSTFPITQEDRTDKINSAKSQIIINRTADASSSAQPSSSRSTPPSAAPSAKPSSVAPSLEPPKANTCMRHCPSRPNKIVVAGNSFGHAGFNDRSYILSILLSLSGYLCARVEVMRPRFLLGGQHNDGVELDPEMTWTEFWDSRFVQDGSEGLVDLVRSDNATRRPFVNYFYGTPQYANWLQLRMEKPGGDAISNFEAAESFSMNQTYHDDDSVGFIWAVGGEFYSWEQPLLQYLKDRRNANRADEALPTFATGDGGCEYYNMNPSIHRVNLLREIWDAIPSEDMIGTLHIRRGDSKRTCDTSLERMDEYLECSFKEAVVLGNYSTTLLLFSDERDQKYRRAVADLAHRHGGVKVVDLDAFVWQRIQQNVELDAAPRWRLNNFFLYSVVSLSTWDPRVAFRLERRREFACPVCTNINEQVTWYLNEVP